MKPVVITYTRFSTKIQTKGISQKRQDELTRKAVIEFCEKHDVELDSVISLKDKGVSAYRQKNLTQGSLKEIFALFKSGELKKTYDENGDLNNYLFVESLDRLTRANLHKSLSLFLEILEYTNLVILADGEKKVYTQAKLQSNDGMFDLFHALTVLTRSHNESVAKEFRGKKNWEGKREAIKSYFAVSEEERSLLKRPKNATKTCPWWLKPKKDDCGFEFIEENRKAMMFFLDLLLNDYGLSSAIRRLNSAIEDGQFKVIFSKKQEKAQGFQTHTFYQLFKEGNETIAGHLIFHTDYYVTEQDIAQNKYPENKNGKKVRIVDEVVKGYYPALLSETDFKRIKRKLAARKQEQTKPTKKIRNILQGILKCPLCGYSYVYVADNRKNRHHNLVCGFSRSGKCKSYSYRYDFIESNFLNYCRNLDIGKILNSENPDLNKTVQLENDLASLTEKQISIQEELDQHLKNLSVISNESILLKLQEAYSQKEKVLDGISSKIVDISSELDIERKNRQNNSSINESLGMLIEKVFNEKNVDVREKLNIELKKIIKDISIIHRSSTAFNMNMLSVSFRDGFTRLIPINKILGENEMYELPPILELSEIEKTPNELILPFDYIEGKEEGRYPEIAFMPKYYQENPEIFMQITKDIESADSLLKVN